MEDVLAGIVALPDELAVGFVDGDEGWGFGGRWRSVLFVDAVAGAGENEVAADDGRARGEVVGVDAELAHHVEDPDEVGVLFVLVPFVGQRAVVFVVVEAGGVGADELTAVADVVDAVALDAGVGGDALLGPIDRGAAGQLVVRGLPEQLAGLLVEAEEAAFVAFAVGAEVAAVVGADVDVAGGDDRRAVGGGAERGDPLHVRVFVEIPLLWYAGGCGGGVAVRCAAEHGPVRDRTGGWFLCECARRGLRASRGLIAWPVCGWSSSHDTSVAQ